MNASSRTGSIAAWIVAILLFVAFIGAGFSKLFGQAMMVKEYQIFGYPLWFMVVTGVIEIASAILVIVPRTSRIGAALLICVMLGAIYSHVVHGQVGMIAVPVVLLALAIALLQAAEKPNGFVRRGFFRSLQGIGVRRVRQDERGVRPQQNAV